MGDFFKHFIDFVKDKTTTWGFKTALFISILTLGFLTDYFVGFSKNYHFNNKIEQLEKLTALKLSYQSDSIVLSELREMEAKIVKGKHYSERFSLLFLNESSNPKKLKIIDKKNLQVTILQL